MTKIKHYTILTIIALSVTHSTYTLLHALLKLVKNPTPNTLIGDWIFGSQLATILFVSLSMGLSVANAYHQNKD